MSALRAWRAGFVRRWHSHPDLCDTHDSVAGHQGRTAILVLALFPDASRDLIVAALTHDQGEVASGDASRTLKRKRPDVAAALREIEAAEIAEQGFAWPDLTAVDAARLKLCDELDALLWAIRHRPRLLARADWQAHVVLLLDIAGTLDVRQVVDRVIRDARAAA